MLVYGLTRKTSRFYEGFFYDLYSKNSRSRPAQTGFCGANVLHLPNKFPDVKMLHDTKKYIYICYDILNKIYLEYHSQLHYICTLKTICMKQKKKHTLLKGEGINQHTLYGEFKIDETENEFTDLVVTKDSLLKHEQPTGAFSNEHQTLKIEKGEWSMGKQVEYNPFNQQITRVWD